MGGAMYVEVMVPKQIRSPYPIVFFHGAGQTGVDWLQTPDGRPGWAYNFLDMGYVVYMTDFPTRGRSQYVPGVDGREPEHPHGAEPRGDLHRRRGTRQFPAGQEAHPVARHRPHRRQGVRRVHQDAGAVPRGQPPGDADARRERRAARRDQHAGHPADPFAGRLVRLAGRRRPAESRQGDRDARAGGAADSRRRHREGGVQPGRRPELGRGEQPHRLRAGDHRCEGAADRRSRRRRPRPTRCPATCSRSRRAS